MGVAESLPAFLLLRGEVAGEDDLDEGVEVACGALAIGKSLATKSEFGTGLGAWWDGEAKLSARGDELGGGSQDGVPGGELDIMDEVVAFDAQGGVSFEAHLEQQVAWIRAPLPGLAEATEAERLALGDADRNAD